MLDTLLELLALEALPRTGWIQAGLRDVESVGAHSHGVALLVLILGPDVEPEIRVDHAASLAIVHDAPEALIGDLPRTASEMLPAGTKSRLESGAADRLLGSAGTLARDRFAEYAAGETREARFARLCDKLHLGLRAYAYSRAGAGGMDPFLNGLRSLDCAEFEPAESLRAAILDNISTA
ncbi:MAG: HD domain-containing protein [Planctomycetota bacterium]|jgi:putative hydrolase of HD superfamily